MKCMQNNPLFGPDKPLHFLSVACQLLKIMKFLVMWLVVVDFTIVSCVRNHLSEHDTVRAVQMLEDGSRQVDVSRRLGVSQSVISRLWRRYRENGLFHARERSGRPRSLSAVQDRYLLTTAQRNRFQTARSLSVQLQNATGVRVSTQTVRNRLHAAGLNARRPMLAPRLTARHRQARLAFAQDHMEWRVNDWSNVLFTDESRFCVSTNDRRVRVWRRRNERFAQCAIMEHEPFGGPSVMVWAGISVEGRTDLHVFARGGITAQRYRDEVILPIVLPYAGAVGPDFVFMDDNAPIHRARLVEQCLLEQGIDRLDWPARSPDLNPIEHLWDTLGRAVRNRQQPPRNVQELGEALTEEWAAIQQRVISRLILSMRRRCQACVNSRGGQTRY